MEKATSKSRRWRVWTRLWLRLQSSLSIKMGAIVVVGVLALVALFTYLGEAALNDNIQHSLQARVVVAESTARHIDYALDIVKADLTRAAQQSDLVDPSRRSAAVRAAYAELQVFGSPVFILDRTGQVIDAYPPITSTVSLTASRAVSSVLSGEDFAISKAAYPLSGAGRWPLAVAALKDSSSSVAGALGVSIDLDSPHLRVFADPIGLDGSEYMDLVDDDGTILASTRPDRVGTESDHNAVISRMIAAGQPVVSQCHSCHAAASRPAPNPEVMAFAPLGDIPWGVMVRQDEAQVMAAARELQLRIFTLGAIALLGALLLVYLTTRSVIMPVQELTRAAQRIAAGDLETPIQRHGSDEIGLLARAFDTMRARVKSSIAEIQSWNQELDSRVRERTEALGAAQRQVQESRDRLQAVIDSLSDDLLVVDRDFRVTRVNGAVERRYGQAVSLVGARCFQVLHSDRRCEPPNCECPITRVFESGEPCMVTHVHEDPDGDKRYLQVAATPLKDSRGAVESVVELWRDVTEEKELQETILRRNRELSATNAIARVVGQSLKLDECLRLALEQVREITKLDVGSIFLMEGDERRLKLHCFYGLPKEAAEVTYRSALTDSACGGVLELG
ncbi:MAG: PAS domain-containing protein, partial [Chloroflexi bacterium]|nr:PAS domain-containing protein [Chloroflexota bacterium]